MEPEKRNPCPFVTAQKLLAGKWSILILHTSTIFFYT